MLKEPIGTGATLNITYKVTLFDLGKKG